MSSGRVALKLLTDLGDMLGLCSGNLPLKVPKGFRLRVISKHCLCPDLTCLTFSKGNKFAKRMKPRL